MNYYDDLEIPFAMHVIDGHLRVHTPLYYGIQYNQSGTVHLQIGNGPKHVISGPAVFITHPGTKFSYHLLPEEKHNYHAVCFMGNRVMKFLESGLLSLDPVVYPIQDSKKFMQTILELIEMRKIGKLDICVNLLENLLLQIRYSGDRNHLAEVTPYQSKALKSLAEKIRRNYGDMWDFSEEAKKLFVSERHFRSLFAQVNELPPLHYLLRIRLEQAAERLIHTRDIIKAVAEECGFKDEFYFSRIFKKYYHLSPKQYRREFNSFK